MSPALRSIARSPRLRQIAIQLLKRAPEQARLLLRVPQTEHTKALALLTSAYARLATADPDDPTLRATAVELGQRLAAKALSTPNGVAWGYDFDVQTRWGYYRCGQPNAVVTAFAVHALLDVERYAPELRSHAEAAAAYATAHLLTETDDGRFFAYYEGSREVIHNASLLVASALARLNDVEQRQAASDAVRFSLDRQTSNGAWPYGDSPRLAWIDGFHTAYVLWSLNVFDLAERHVGLRPGIERGVEFYVTHLFDPDGAPKATTTRRFPIDIHAASSAIWVLSELRDLHPQALPTAERVLNWTLANMRRDDGRFMFQRHKRRCYRTAFIRWNDAHMMLALAACRIARCR